MDAGLFQTAPSHPATSQPATTADDDDHCDDVSRRGHPGPAHGALP